MAATESARADGQVVYAGDADWELEFARRLGADAIDDRTLNASSSLQLDVDLPERVMVSGTLTVNGGALPLQDGYDEACVYLTFGSLDGYEGVLNTPCRSLDGAFEAEVWAGRYVVSATRSYYDPAVVPASSVVVQRLELQ